jgi:hypothetical protein
MFLHECGLAFSSALSRLAGSGSADLALGMKEAQGGLAGNAMFSKARLGAAGHRSELCEFGAGALGVCPELCRAIDSEMEPPGCGVGLNRRGKFADYRR